MLAHSRCLFCGLKSADVTLCDWMKDGGQMKDGSMIVIIVSNLLGFNEHVCWKCLMPVIMLVSLDSLGT
jgi:hypothetical protein